MYAVYKQAHPPTGLEFSMYCNFFNNSERNLVVAGTSQLYVYRLNRDAEVLLLHRLEALQDMTVVVSTSVSHNFRPRKVAKAQRFPVDAHPESRR
uniref:Cleavage and polyadenylation specific factor 1 n=1 Tax=Balaenoptera musculus TaxID=9771 RepID=A0A8C0DII2_BALMU